MIIKLNNGIELAPIVVMGESKFAQGAQRDTLKFVFPASVGMDYLDSTFTPAACESINIVDDNGNEAIHKGYTLRVSVAKETVMVAPGTAEADATYEDRITVTMGERTYAESQLASLTETVDVLVMESLMG